MKLKFHRIKFLDQKTKLKCREKNPLRTHLRKNKLQTYFLCFAFLDLSWNSDDENDNIFESERSFSGVFNTFVKWCVKNDKNVFNLAYIPTFSEIPEMLETHAQKKSMFNTTAKLKCRKL